MHIVDGGWGFSSFALQSQHGRTALNVAAYFGRTECVRLLLEAGADKDATDDVRDMTDRSRMFTNATSRVSSSIVFVILLS